MMTMDTETGSRVVAEAVDRYPTAVEFTAQEQEAAVEQLAAELGETRNEFDLPELAATMEEAVARSIATRYLNALKVVEYEMGANEAELRTTLAYYRERHEDRQGTLGRQRSYLKSTMETLLGFMKLTGKKKSLNLLGGRVGMRAKQDELVVENPDDVIQWAKENGMEGLIRTKTVEEVDKKALRMYMEHVPTIPGQGHILPPGVSLNERPDEFYATPAAD